MHAVVQMNGTELELLEKIINKKINQYFRKTLGALIFKLLANI